MTISPEPMTPETGPVATRHALVRRADRFLRFTQRLELLAVPALVPHYVDLLGGQFAALGRAFTEDELEALASHLAAEIGRAHQVSAYGRVVVDFESEPFPALGVRYNVAGVSSTMADQYRHWLETRAAPLFGSEADRMVLDQAALGAAPRDAPVLDVGAGAGRNALALARLGHPVDALEVTDALRAELEQEVAATGLDVRVLAGDVLAADTPLPRGKYALAVVSQVVSHFRSVAELRVLFERMAEATRPGGRVVVNVFLAAPEYPPTALAVELSQAMWSSAFTYGELDAAMEGLPLRLTRDERVYDYERARFGPGQWPPTGWYETWVLGLDVFALPHRAAPIEFHWLVLERTGGA